VKHFIPCLAKNICVTAYAAGLDVIIGN